MTATICRKPAAPACAIYSDSWEGECITDCLPVVEAPTCSSPFECLETETCGDDGACHSGNCRFWGCVEGYSCVTTERTRDRISSAVNGFPT